MSQHARWRGLVVDSFAFAKAVRGSCPAAEPMPTGGRFMVEKVRIGLRARTPAVQV